MKFYGGGAALLLLLLGRCCCTSPGRRGRTEPGAGAPEREREGGSENPGARACLCGRELLRDSCVFQ